MIVEALIFGIGAAVLIGGGVKLKNVVQDKNMVEGENFTKWDSLFKKYGGIYGVDWIWLKAICMNESSLGRAKSVEIGLQDPSDIQRSMSFDGKSWGLMQMTIPTAKDYDVSATPAKLNDPDYSVKLAAKHLRMLERLFDTVDLRYEEWVIKSYNQGQGNTFKERSGEIKGYAQEYWERYVRNKKLLGE